MRRGNRFCVGPPTGIVKEMVAFMRTPATVPARNHVSAMATEVLIKVFVVIVVDNG